MLKSFGLKSKFYSKTTSAGIVSSGLVSQFDGANSVSNTGSGNTWYNLAANYHGTISGGPYRSADGGGSFELGEGRGYITVSTPDMPAFNVGTGNFSCSLWFKVANLNIRQLVLTKYAIWTDIFDFGFVFRDDIKAIAFWAGNGGALRIDSVSNSVNSTSVWFNVCVVRTSGVTKLYLNDVEKASTNTSVNIQNAAPALWMGYNKDGDEPMRNAGKIAHFSFYNKALTDAERTQNFNALKTRFGL